MEIHFFGHGTSVLKKSSHPVYGVDWYQYPNLRFSANIKMTLQPGENHI